MGWQTMTCFTITAVARRFGLSRSTLLYYDRIGLVRPSGRSAAGYRIYSDKDLARMARLVLYRDAGLPLAAIGPLLNAPDNRGRAALTARLEQINGEIRALRGQQRVIGRLLGDPSLARGAHAMTKDGWITVLRATGLSAADMDRWHREFERRAPQAHNDFLESLGIAPDEVARIRAQSRSDE